LAGWLPDGAAAYHAGRDDDEHRHLPGAAPGRYGDDSCALGLSKHRAAADRRPAAGHADGCARCVEYGFDLADALDGLRLLQGTVVDITCNVGTAGVRNFAVGGVQGVGTYFNINQCQDEPDTAGWFVGVNPFGRSYLFYIYIEPITTYNDARGDMQKLLDSVVFQQSTQVTPTATATPGS
jgi:hypothetical protein